MKVWFKRILISLVGVAIVAVVGLAIFLLTFDPNAYKSKLEDLVYNRYDRTLVIEGDIELSLFPRIGLSVQGVSLSDRDSASTFASVDTARFAVAIWPLLSNRLVVDHVAITGLKAWVVRDKHGVFNFHDLVERRPSRSASSTMIDVNPISIQPVAVEVSDPVAAPAILAVLNPQTARTDFQIDIAGLTLKDSEIHLYDVKTGSVARVVKLDVNTGRMTFDQPFDVALKGKLTGDYPEVDAHIDGQALVKMNPDEKTYSAQKLNVQVTGRLGDLHAKMLSLRGNIGYSGFSRMFTASGLELIIQGEATGARAVKNLNASLSVPQLRINQSQDEVKIEKLALRVKGDTPAQHIDIALDAPSLAVSPDMATGETISATVKATGTSVLGISLGLGGLGGNAHNLTLKELKIEAALKQGDRVIQLNVSSPAKWDTWDDVGGLSAIKGDVRIEAASLPNGSFEFPLIGSLQADLAKDVLNSEIDAVLNGSKLGFTVAATQLHDPRVVFDLKADSLDFDTLFPPLAAPAVASPSKKDTDKPAAATPAPPAKPPAVKAAPAAKAVGAPEADAPIDLSILDLVHISGNVKIGALKVRELEAEQFSAVVLAGDGQFSVSKIAAKLYGGTLAGKISAASNNAMAGQFALNGVAVGGVLKSRSGQELLSGTGDLRVELHSKGATQAELIAGLQGSVQTRLRDGAVTGLDIAKTLREVNDVVRNVFSGQVPDVATRFDPGRRTGFTSLNADIVFDKGRGTLKKLDVVAPLLRISESTPALIDLANDTLDILLKVRIVKAAAGSDNKDMAVLKGVAVPVLLSGPLAAPVYQVQWKDIGSQVVKQAVQDGLLDLLSNKADETHDPESAAEPERKAAEKSLDPVKMIGDALKGLLGQ